MVFWDFVEKKFYIFGVIYWLEDFYFLFVILIICVFGLFFIIVFVGCVWCGYVCF